MKPSVRRNSPMFAGNRLFAANDALFFDVRPSPDPTHAPKTRQTSANDERGQHEGAFPGQLTIISLAESC